MKNYIDKLVNAAHQFSAIDFAIFKVCLLTIGILLGAYFSPFFKTYMLVVWIIAIITWLALMVQLLKYLKNQEE